MKIHQTIGWALGLAIIATRGAAQSSVTMDGAGGAKGDVVVVESATHQASKDASRVVVWLVPLQPVQAVHAGTDKSRYRLVQHNKRFEPSLLVVPVGSVVDFPNLDPWFHNVFSLYRGKRFDLGLYQAGSQRSVKFDRPGPSYLFCNIHPEMTGVVLAVDSELFAISDRSGHYVIPGVPPGRYVMHVWYEQAAPEALQALQRTVTIDAGGNALPSLALTAARRTPSEHKNKYGENYDPEGIKTEY